jgi:HJR/Mrr/RecB family endonuclease
MSYRRRFIKCHTSQVLHFDTTMTSRDEDSHAILKQQLSKFPDDFKTIVNDINFMLINELQNYRIALDDERMRYFMKLRKSVFEQLVFFVTTIALRKILSQYKLMIERFTVMSACINVFITIIELLCSHRIQKRLFQKKCLLIEDVHSY